MIRPLARGLPNGRLAGKLDLMRFPNLAFGKPRLRLSDYNHSATHIQHVGGQHSLLVEIEKLHRPQRFSSRMFTHSDHDFTPDNAVFNPKLGLPVVTSARRGVARNQGLRPCFSFIVPPIKAFGKAGWGRLG